MRIFRRAGREPGSIDHSISSWSKRRVLSWTLFTLAGLVVVQHLVAHAGWQPLPLSMGWQDITVGYPMAALLAIGGLMSLDPHPKL